MSDSDATSLLVEDRFGRLKKYFRGVGVDELRFISASELVLDAEPQDKPLMRALTRKILSFLSDLVRDSDSESDFDRKEEEETLDLTQKIHSSKFDHWINLDSKSILRIISELDHQDSSAAVKVILMSGCSLFDVDLPDVIRLVSLFPQVAFVDLSFNRFRGGNYCNGAVRDWLLGAKCYVDLSTNSFSTMDNRDFFRDERNDKSVFERLIFIPKGGWLKTGGWKLLFNGRKDYQQICDTVIRAHKRFRRDFALIAK